MFIFFCSFLHLFWFCVFSFSIVLCSLINFGEYINICFVNSCDICSYPCTQLSHCSTLQRVRNYYNTIDVSSLFMMSNDTSSTKVTRDVVLDYYLCFLSDATIFYRLTLCRENPNRRSLSNVQNLAKWGECIFWLLIYHCSIIYWYCFQHCFRHSTNKGWWSTTFVNTNGSKPRKSTRASINVATGSGTDSPISTVAQV